MSDKSWSRKGLFDLLRQILAEVSAMRAELRAVEECAQLRRDLEASEAFAMHWMALAADRGVEVDRLRAQLAQRAA
jgi:hypothetical protein